jgi:NitT/TauT family transport system permease protein
MEIGKFVVEKTSDGELLAACGVTLQRLLIGYFIGIILGIPLGLLNARFKFVNNTLGVVALGLQTLPSVCWVPLSLLWFGQTETAMLFIVIMGTLWAVLLATDNGIRQIPPIYRRAAATMGSSGLHLLWRVLLPASLPHLVSGTKQGWAFAWRSLMAAEIYVSVLKFGLGHLLHYGRELHAMDQVAAVMLVILIIGFAADKILFTPWEQFLRRRWGLTV